MMNAIPSLSHSHDGSFAFVHHDYHDHSNETARDLLLTKLKGDGVFGRVKPTGGVTMPFPMKLHLVLAKAEECGFDDIISWQPHGRCFVVHDPRRFVETIMPSHFNQSKFTSFQRQLNLYGFRRITTGLDRNAYYHEYFLKYKTFLCEKITRTSVKGNGVKAKPNPDEEPNFYSMPFLVPDGGTGNSFAPSSLNGQTQSSIGRQNQGEELNSPNIESCQVSPRPHRNTRSPPTARLVVHAAANRSFVSCCENPELEWEALNELKFDPELSFLACG